ncbi:hypothetical protein EG328_011130 [Venturia inaequalis]|uniref:Uncharacterized protein n=1 Tax=Venturia inaequalis TaxID=5025 RepID=A0A8H3VGJ3_VENIN|nr:hypothetical protein EG328_011130 [Venturia inaequalis]
MSPPSLLTIPRELRHQILHFTIEDAVNEDLKLNVILRKLANRFVDSYPVPQACHIKFDGLLSYNDYDEEEGKLTDYAPHMYAQALTLRSEFPELEEDIAFVLGQALSRFEEENESARGKSLDEEWKRYWSRYPNLAGFFASKFPRGQRMAPST